MKYQKTEDIRRATKKEPITEEINPKQLNWYERNQKQSREK